MIVQMFYKNILKECFFQNILDGRYELYLYSYETGLNEDIEFYIDINNGIRRVNGRFSAVAGKDGKEYNDNIINEDSLVLLNLRNSNEKIGLLIFESSSDIVTFDKYMIDTDYVEVGNNGPFIYKNNSGISRFFALQYEDSKAYVIPYINRIYHCGKLISDKKRVHFGDIISCGKLKLIYLGNVLAINSPEEKIKCELQRYRYKENKIISAVNSRFDTDEEENYFTRSPRITHRLITETVEIDPPTNKKENKEKPLLYVIGPSLTMSMAMIVSVIFMIRANGNRTSMIPSSMMAVSMFMGAVLWPILLRKYTRKQAIREENIRKEKYKAYIDKIDKNLNEKAEYNRKIYAELFPSLEGLLNSALKTDSTLWNHTPFNEGFLDIRIGKGVRKSTVDINIPKERFIIEDDPLRDYASVIQQKYKYLSDVPISVSLENVGMVGVIGDKSKQEDLVRTMILRIAVTHSYDEVKIAVLFNKKDSEYWNFTKWLPHCWSKGKKLRMLANDKAGSYIVLNKLKEIYEERISTEKNTRPMPHYVIFVNDGCLLGNDSNIKDFIDKAWKYGMTFVFAYDSIAKLPNVCQNIIQLSQNECTIHDKNDNSGKMMTFIPDISEGVNANKISEILSSIKINEASEETMIPERLNFLEMYKAKNIDELVIPRRWNEAQSFKTLEAPIGIGSNDEIFSLNIHEKYHGPHGLIAGTTGSGKSEFIQSYILSLAINYHPYDVSFMLIDYKGGGMANAFAKLPHTAGIITNLGGNQIKRSLASLNSELKRRQEIFNENGLVGNEANIYEYQMRYHKGIVKEPLPHLIVISDEFAELKMQEPEFMNELISTARIGRSPGVHLILATQKPSGVVNDQILGNTKFRVCLKVADRQDSKEMLKRDDAAAITLPGRCCVQVGNDEIFKIVQSGYSGEKYNDNNINNDDISVVCIDLQANELYRTSRKNISENTDDSRKTQLSAIVDYIHDYSESQGIKALELWRPPLPEAVAIQDIDKRPGGFNGNKWTSCGDWLNVAIGIYDEPEKQNQGMLNIDFGQNGHMLLYGSPGTGKTTFFQTLIYAMSQRYSPEVVNMYIMDFGSRSLSYCKDLPHVGDVVFSDDSSKLDKLFQRFEKELSERKKLLAEYGVGNLKSYMQASGKIIPAIILFIDNYSAFTELYQEYETALVRLSREGGNYGIYLAFNCASVNAVKRRISENIKSVYTLQLNDTYDYMNVGLGNRPNVFPENVKGRGLANIGTILEFQTALAVDEINEAERVKHIRADFRKMAEAWKGAVPENLPVIPEDMDIESVILNDDYINAINAGKIPVGYDTEEISLISLDFDNNYVFNVIGDSETGKSTVLANVIRTNVKREVWLIDSREESIRKLLRYKNIVQYANNSEKISELVYSLALEMNKRHEKFKEYSGKISKSEFIKQYYNDNEILLIIDDFDYLFNMFSDTSLEIFRKTLDNAVGLGMNLFVGFNAKAAGKYRSQGFEKIFRNERGVVLGSIDNLTLFNINVPYAVKNKYEMAQGKGFYVDCGEYKPFKAPFIKAE